MLENSFILLKGIGQAREKTLWSSGILAWDDFLSADKIPRISPESKSRMDSDLAQAANRLEAGDSSYFATTVPRREQWRCLGDFRESVAYLDIETTGISHWSPITMVGIFDGKRMHTLVRGINLNGQSLRAILSSASIIVTFNGSSFDLPIIETQYPGSVPNIPHVDLRNVMRRIGHVGGLKMIERQLGIARDRRVEYMTGADAVYLWRIWEKQGRRNALDLLTEYNAEDCKNLKRLAEYSYAKLRRGTFENLTSPGKG